MKVKNSDNLEMQLKRALADYQNLQKRFEKQKKEIEEYANQTLLTRLLSILEGLEMVNKQLEGLLENEGFVKIEIKEGDAFDRNSMEAIDGEGLVVDEVYTHPYALHDRIIRPGRVKARK